MRTTIFLNKIEVLPNSSNSFEWKMKKTIISNLLVLENREKIMLKLRVARAQSKLVLVC